MPNAETPRFETSTTHKDEETILSASDLKDTQFKTKRDGHSQSENTDLGCRKFGPGQGQAGGKSLNQKFFQALHRFDLKPGDKILVAVSGGPDSVCLLHLLRTGPPGHRHALHVAHLNHGLRREADEEARFVEALCRAWSLPFTSAKRPAALPNGTKRKGNLQAAARELRYHFLAEVAQAVGAHWIALGHTADDQAETVVMRILRGAGPAGLSGISERRFGGVIRPLLNATRQEILDRLNQEKIAYIDDPSNQKKTYQRNRIRHELLPILAKYNPNVKDALCRTATLLQTENDFVHQAMQALLPTLEIETGSTRVVLNKLKLQPVHPALQRRILRWAIEKLLGKGKGIDFQSIEILRLEIVSGLKDRIALPCGLHAHIKDESFFIERSCRSSRTGPRHRGIRQDGFREKGHPAQERILFETPPTFSKHSGETVLRLPEWGLEMKMRLQWGRPKTLSACIASFDFDKLSYPLVLRRWRAGDRFAPLGMGGKQKKLQDFFVDAKIPKTERGRQAVLVCPKGILWVVGLRVDERFRATKDSLRTLNLRLNARPK